MAEWMSIVRMLNQLLIMKYANDHNQVLNWSAHTRLDGDSTQKCGQGRSKWKVVIGVRREKGRGGAGPDKRQSLIR